MRSNKSRKKHCREILFFLPKDALSGKPKIIVLSDSNSFFQDSINNWVSREEPTLIQWYNTRMINASTVPIEISSFSLNQHIKEGQIINGTIKEVNMLIGKRKRYFTYDGLRHLQYAKYHLLSLCSVNRFQHSHNNQDNYKNNKFEITTRVAEVLNELNFFLEKKLNYHNLPPLRIDNTEPINKSIYKSLNYLTRIEKRLVKLL